MLREHDEFVVQTRQDRSDSGLADLASLRISTDSDDRHDLVERSELLDFDDGEQVNSTHFEVDTQSIKAKLSAVNRKQCRREETYAEETACPAFFISAL